jgi:hypothetical protein
MVAEVEKLEAKRTKLLETLNDTGDMRRGSISEVYRRCGKSNCACASSEHRRHGPYYAFTRKVAGKTQTVQLRAGPELDKLLEEVRTYHGFRAAVEQLVEVNEQICKLRPVVVTSVSKRRSLKKKLPRSSRLKSRPRSGA